MSDGVLKSKSFRFAVRIVRLYNHLAKHRQEYVMAKQLLRSGTAVGAMVREAEFGQPKADFIHKLSIAQQEINESLYWIELLGTTNYLTSEQADSIHNDATELLKLLTSSIKTAKINLTTNH